MTVSRMARFWGGGNGDPYTETTAGMDGAAPVDGDEGKFDNNSMSAYRRWMMRQRMRRMGMDPNQQAQPGTMGDMYGAPAGVTPIQWEDTTGGQGGGSGGGISRLFSMFGGG